MSMLPRAPEGTRLPAGFAVAIARHTEVLEDGAALLGGSPTRYVRPAGWAAPLIAGGTIVVDDARSGALADRLLELGMADPVPALLPPIDAPYTVVVPVRDRPAQLDRLLAGIAAGTGQRPAGVIVVDDGSDDGAPIAAVTSRHGAELVRLEENLGPAHARNEGLRRVGTPFVVFVDSDVALSCESVEILLRHFTDPRVALVAPRVSASAGTDTAVERYEEVRASQDLGGEPATVRPFSRVSWVSTTCVVARVSAIGEGFDTALRVGEDVDLCWRLVENGWRIRYEPRASVAHEHRSSLGAWLTRKAVYGSSAQPLAERHPDAIAPAVLAPWSALVVAAVLVGRRWSVAVAAGILVYKIVEVARKLGTARHPRVLAARLIGNGTVSSFAQVSALALRHWWPVAVVGCAVSSRVRRFVAIAAIVDTVVELARTRVRLDPVRFGILRRLDDLAYGAGVWLSAIRARSWKALKPRLQLQSQSNSNSKSSLGNPRQGS